MGSMLSFDQPYFLLLLVLLLPLWSNYINGRKKAALKFPAIAGVKESRPGKASLSSYAVHGGIFLRSLALVCLICALARPQFGQSEVRRYSEGLDIMMAFDTSGSMRAMDFEVEGQTSNRLMAVKYVLEKFVKERSEDRIGMVVFGTEAFTQLPLTLDHDVFLQFLKPIKIGMAGDATAIGDALATATNRLKDIKAKSKIIILLTDGENTAGTIEPMTAAKAAAALGVHVYTVGVGRDGKVPIPVDSVFGERLVYQEVNLDEELLKDIAKTCNGQYFRAYDTDSLKKIYETIDRLEKTKIQVKEFKNYDEAFAVFLWPGLLFLFLELLFGMSRFRRVP
jgi:Ca-activated chloride channel homolog